MIEMMNTSTTKKNKRRRRKMKRKEGTKKIHTRRNRLKMDQ